MELVVVLLGILLSVPVQAFPSARWSDLQSAPVEVAATLVATHATKGVVKSVDATSLVIARPALKAKNITFALNPATEREGQVTVGSTVEVRYRTMARQRIATAIRVQDITLLK